MMTDYIQTLESQNLELREENARFRYLFEEPDTHKEIWHVDAVEYLMCEDGNRKPFKSTIPFFSPQLAFIRFALSMKACKDIDYTEADNLIFGIKTTKVYPSKLNNTLTWMCWKIIKGKKEKVEHIRIDDRLDHPAKQDLADCVEDLSNAGFELLPVLLLP